MAAAVARCLLAELVGAYGVWPVRSVRAGTAGRSTAACVSHGIWPALHRCFSGAVDHSRLHMAEMHNRGTSRGNAGGGALAACILHTWDHVLHTVDTRRLVRRPRLDPRDWLGTLDTFPGHTVCIAKKVDAWHGTLAFVAGLLFGNPHTADTRNCDTTNLVRTMLAKVSHTGDKFYRQGTATRVDFLHGTSLQLAAPLFGNLHTVDRRSSDTMRLV